MHIVCRNEAFSNVRNGFTKSENLNYLKCYFICIEFVDCTYGVRNFIETRYLSQLPLI